MLAALPFREIWMVDFEFLSEEGEHPIPICLVAWELRTKRQIRLWRDEMGPSPPYDISRDSLFVSFSSTAELSCHLALGWPLPERVLDLRIEFLQAINFTPRSPSNGNGEKKRSSLLHAMTYYGLDGVEAAEKELWRKTILRGEPWTDTEREGILDYCESDVRAIHQLFPAMVRRDHVHLDHRLLPSLFRGRYMRAVTRMEFTGVPIDLERFDHLKDRWDALERQLIETLGKEYGVYNEQGSFSQKRFARYLNARGWGWPALESGRLDLKDKTFKQMARVHPELEPLRQLKYCREKLKLHQLAVGRDGFNRCWLNPFGSRTSRNQPSNSRFIFGPAVWLRDYLIQPKPGWGIAYLDWSGQEFGIAAALSNDPAMREAYESGDIYLTFGKQAGVLPAGATIQTHGQQRDLFKVCVLATQYGQKYRSLAEQIDQPDIVARGLLEHHHRIYARFWDWSNNRVNRYLLYNEQQTVFGWRLRFRGHPKINSVRNFDMQANGAEMLRLACCRGTEAGISICAPVHDAILMMAPLDRLDEDVARMRAHMEEASQVVLRGFRLRSDQHVFRYPERYSDPQGRGQFMLEMVLKLL
jgi:DNA polymerase family A